MTTESNSSVDQVFDVLAVLSESSEPIGVAPLARALGVPTSTAHRVLLTLQEVGYVSRDTTGTKYQLGLGAHELVHALLRQFPAQGVGQPFLRRLAALTGDTVVLAGRVGWFAVRVAGAEGWREIHAATRLGHTSRLHDTPGGNAILAFLDDEPRQRYLHWLSGGRRLTSAARAVRDALDQVRTLGHVLLHHPDGRLDIAFPLKDGAGQPIASVAVEATGSDDGVSGERARVARVRAVVAELEAVLAEHPEMAIDPFAHLSPDELTLAIAAPATRRG